MCPRRSPPPSPSGADVGSGAHNRNALVMRTRCPTLRQRPSDAVRCQSHAKPLRIAARGHERPYLFCGAHTPCRPSVVALLTMTIAAPSRDGWSQREVIEVTSESQLNLVLC